VADHAGCTKYMAGTKHFAVADYEVFVIAK